MKRITLGIAGYIGSGKTTVARYFEKFGAFFIDADKVVELLYQPKREGFERIHDFFGEEYINKKGILNRKKLAKVIFNDPKKLKILNALIHPLVTTEVQKLVDKSGAPFVVLEATYFERKFLRKMVSAIAWVETDAGIAYERLQTSRGLSREMFEKIRRLQVKPEVVDFLIRNNASLVDLEQQCQEVYRKLFL